MVEYAFQLARS